MTAASSQSSTQAVSTAAYTMPIATTHIHSSGTTAVTTTHNIPIPTYGPPPHQVSAPPQMGYQRQNYPPFNFSLCPCTAQGHQSTRNHSTGSTITDPLFAKTAMPTITTKNTEHSISKLEGWLDINGVFEDERRFLALKMQLDTATYTQVSHAIYNPPQSGKFDHLKRAVIKVFTDSESKKVQDLISGLQLGDKKPSTLLAEMRNLHRGPLDDKIFRELWLKRLPQQVQAILVGTMRSTGTEESLPLERMAECADNIMEHQTPPGSINAVSQPPKKDSIFELLSKINERLEKLERKPDNDERSRSQSRSNSRPRNKDKQHSKDRRRSPTPADKPADEPKICQAHAKYGKGQHLNWNCHPKCSLHREWLQARLDQTKNL